jgi:hypothetical protein
MQRRHPHVFGDEKIADAETQTRAWEALKAREREAAGTAKGWLADVPLALPALTRASKLGKRAASAGFDWPDSRGAREKIGEELAELDEAIGAAHAPERIGAEIGDLLFAVVNSPSPKSTRKPHCARPMTVSPGVFSSSRTACARAGGHFRRWISQRSSACGKPPRRLNPINSFHGF